MSYSKKHNKQVINSYIDLLKGKVYRKVGDLVVESWRTPEPVPFSERFSGEHAVIKQGDIWGGVWDCAWMHVKGTIPAEAKGQKVVLRFDLSDEGCVYDKNGYPIRGITTFVSDFEPHLGVLIKRIIDVTDCAKENEEFEFWIDAACNDMFGRSPDRGALRQAEIAVCDTTLRKFYYDFKFLAMFAETLDEDSTIRNRVEYTLYTVANSTDIKDPDSVQDALSQLARHLNMKNTDDSFVLSAVGHAHIDLAWLWPIRETKRKGVRTFSTALRMMEKYPDYIFGASQPQLYEWVKQAQPGMYEEIRERINEGRWECQGAMWVEPDTNLPGAESLVRQVVYGKDFFKKEFGKDMKILWLPDVFGYSAALPQILKKSDVPYFLTIKLSWNEHNEFPHNTFLWQGIDGSEVLAHMPPENTYNSGAMPSSLRNAEKHFKDNDISGDALMLFGIGDGGGGPSTDHLEYLSREKSIAGLPQTRQQHALEFFDRINEHRDEYAKWRGELYLEKHQGTYTTQSDCKKNNRTIEFALHNCEFVCSMAAVFADFEYPQKELEKIWKEVLLYQFHDILPGSSIKRVYDEANARYAVLRSQVEEITAKAGSALAKSLKVGKNDALFVNTLGFERTEALEGANAGRSLNIPAYGYATESMAEKSTHGNVSVSDGILENDLLKVVFSKEGTILSIYDKQYDREVLNKNLPVNNLVIYDDRGDCWDIPFTYRDKQPKKLVADSMVTENGGLKFTYKYKDSSFVQTISLPDNSKKLVFGLSADWQETFKMLRGVYPIDINTDYANCNIQFGHIKRPTHKNTSWDCAMIEVCAHKWIDLSEEGYGVSLINNCKYGFNVWDNCLDIDLLRSQMYPGENADKGKHEFSYELFIHDGDLLKVTEESYKFNVPVVKAPGSSEENVSGAQSFFSVEQPNVLIETVKLAEDGSGVILRLYESTGRRTRANITAKSAKSAQLVSMIEQDIETLDVKDGSFDLTFRPFEIHTVKVKY